MIRKTMGMSIEEAIRRIDEHNYIHQHKEPRAVYITEALEVAIETMRKYQQMQADYETRLKADLVAMLEELKKEIEELKNEPACCQHFERGVRFSSDIIQQKIDKLKEQTE